MHERTTNGTLFTTFRVFTMSCNELHATGRVISHGSVHLDARPNHARNIIQPFRVFTISCNELHAMGSVIPYCSVHLDARMISPRCGMKCGGFWVCFSCNKLHATGENDLTSVRDSRFRATSCTLRGAFIISVCSDYWHFCVGRCMLKQN